MSKNNALNDVQQHYCLNSVYGKVNDSNMWVELTGLTKEYKATNMGQGFPDYSSYNHINKVIQDVLNESSSLIHQYTRSSGNLT